MTLLAFVLLLLGVVGLALPILPGIPFLVVAVLLFTANSPGLRRRLLNTPVLAPIVRRLDALTAPGTDGLTPWQRVKLKTLTTIEAVLPKTRR